MTSTSKTTLLPSMKSIILLSLSAALLLSSCNQHAEDAHHEQTEHADNAEHADSDAITAATPSPLTLNNGQKWKTDNSTKLHANKLSGIVQAFDNSGDTKFSAYCNLSDAINHELDKLIADCRMKGPEHEALHHWLEPVLHDAEQLKKASNEKEGAAAVKILRTDIQKFNQFFQ